MRFILLQVYINPLLFIFILLTKIPFICNTFHSIPSNHIDLFINVLIVFSY